MSTVVSRSPEETRAAGRGLGARLEPGAVVGLTGGLGAGKTVFAKGIADSLAVESEVTSPSYTIVAEYEGRIPFYHIDLYRLIDAPDFLDLGIEELIYGHGVTVVEWYERARDELPDHLIEVRIERLPDDARHITIAP